MNDNNTILAIETSSNICGISLIEDGAFIDSVDKENQNNTQKFYRNCIKSFKQN